MELLPQTTQDGEKIFLLDENIAICENGKILHYDNLGVLHDTNFECILDEITQSTDIEAIKNCIIDLEKILIDFCCVDLIHCKINNTESFELINEDFVKFKDFTINLETLEIFGNIQNFKDILPTPPIALEAELQEKIKAIVNAIYRKNIENFVDFKYLQEIFNGDE